MDEKRKILNCGDYQDVLSVAVQHSSRFPVPMLPDDLNSSYASTDVKTETDSSASDKSEIKHVPDLLTQGTLNDFIRDLDLCKKKSKVLVSGSRRGTMILKALLVYCKETEDLMMRMRTSNSYEPI